MEPAGFPHAGLWFAPLIRVFCPVGAGFGAASILQNRETRLPRPVWGGLIL
jgi:hypothetical protein